MRHILSVVVLASLSRTALAAGPVILSPSHLEFSTQAPSTEVLTQKFTITSAGATPVALVIEVPQKPWFTVSYTSAITPSEVTVTVPKLSFPPEMLGDVLTIKAGGATILFPITLQYVAITAQSKDLNAAIDDPIWSYALTGVLPGPKSVKLTSGAGMIERRQLAYYRWRLLQRIGGTAGQLGP